MIFQHFQNKELQAQKNEQSNEDAGPVQQDDARASGFAVPVRARSSRWSSSRSTTRALVTVWNAANSPTLKWYGSLFEDHQILSAAWLSIQVAAMSATGAVILGTLAGLVLSRFGPFKGRALLQGLTTAPLVMPEVITGLSMLLLFVSLEQLFTALVRLAVRPRRRDDHHRAHHLHDGLCHGGRAVAPGQLRRFAGGGRARPRRAAGQGVLPHHRAADPAGHPVRAGCWPSRFHGTTWS